MSGQALSSYTTRVRVVFQPYSHTTVQSLLKDMQGDFGLPGDRWRFVSPDLGDPDPTDDGNAWKVDFWFRDGRDAVLFALKYQVDKYQRPVSS